MPSPSVHHLTPVQAKAPVIQGQHAEPCLARHSLGAVRRQHNQRGSVLWEPAHAAAGSCGRGGRKDNSLPQGSQIAAASKQPRLVTLQGSDRRPWSHEGVRQYDCSTADDYHGAPTCKPHPSAVDSPTAPSPAGS